jgi:hypothetical protein
MMSRRIGKRIIFIELLGGETRKMAKYKINGRIVTGTELVKIANKEFTKDSRGRGRYGRPKTADGAYSFLRHTFNVQWWNAQKKRWVP